MTPTGIQTIRSVIPADTTAMADLLNEIIDIGGTTALEDHVDAHTLQVWFLDPMRAHCCHVAIDDKGKVAGFQALEKTEAYGQGIGEISTFARQTPVIKGVGTALFKATKAAARGAGLSAINAKIRADNTPGLAYYTKMGFQDHSVIHAVPLRNGTPVDRVLKRFPLN